MEKIIIIGSGPAGLTAGMYAARAGLSPLVIEGIESGGQLMQTSHVSNFPGFVGTVTGADIIAALRKQAEMAGARFLMDEVRSVDFSNETKKLHTLMGDTLEAKSVIIASGAGVEKTLKPGEAQFWGRGISACLACDANLYKGRRVALVGTGSAVDGAKKYLGRIGAMVVGEIPPTELVAFTGEANHLAAIEKSDGSRIETDGVFLLTARIPQTKFLNGAVELDSKGHIIIKDGTRTSAEGIFAAGDCARPRYKQAVIAAGDGALAAMEAHDFLSRRK